jgi:hypothetical protein
MKIFVYGSNRERCEEKKIMEDGSDLMGGVSKFARIPALWREEQAYRLRLERPGLRLSIRPKQRGE